MREDVDRYAIKVEGHIGVKRLGLMGSAEVEMLEDGTTLILCRRCDQAKLHSVLNRIMDLGLALLEVKKMK